MDILRLLTNNKLKISVAESCTGGLVAKLLTDNSGASACFDMGFITYSNEAKTRLLGVSPQTLSQYGAVSAETALQMCEGAAEKSDADIALSVTGIAGPTGGSPSKPVGLVYIGVCGKFGAKTQRFIFSGERSDIRNAAALKAIQIAGEYIVQYYN